MDQSQLKAIQPKTYLPRTSDGRADQPSPNLLLDTPLPSSPNRVWAGDITYIPTTQGWLYLPIILDLHSRKVVGWSLAKSLHSQLVIDALSQALQTRRPAPGLIFHSDRGSQYASQIHRQTLKAHIIRQSMSTRANPYHNAWSESFMATLKNELVTTPFQNEAQARIQLFEYIESYYNCHRRHSSLGYQTPTEFEANLTLAS